MASAYTPGLTVSGDIVVRRVRRLPIKGEVLVSVGDKVSPSTVVARAQLPGILQTVRMSEKLGIEAQDVPGVVSIKKGDKIEKEQILAETKGLFGMFKQKVTSDFAGTVEEISEITGSILIREPSTPIDINAYLDGTVAEIMDEEGAIIETRGAMVQGIFGVGGERQGVIRVAVGSTDEVLTGSHIKESDKGAILIGGSGISYDAITRAAEVGVLGLVAGGLKDSDLVKYLGYDIGVAITGSEAIPLTILVTEGFGFLAMAGRTFELFKSLEGKMASVNGATQIRAGVIRPEIIVTLTESTGEKADPSAFELKEGTAIRCIREPYFGQLGSVTSLPAQLVTLESGTEVRVLRAKLSSGEEVTVPRANVEIVAGK